MARVTREQLGPTTNDHFLTTGPFLFSFRVFLNGRCSPSIKKSTHVMPEARRGKNEAAEVFVTKKMKNTKKIIFRDLCYKTLQIAFFGER